MNYKNNDKKPNLIFFESVWCIAFYKVFNLHKTKLEPRGIISIFVGYAQNLKAYRLI